MDEIKLNKDDELLTPKEVMKMLKVSRKTLDRYCSSGKLRKLMLAGTQVRFLRSEVVKLLQ